MLTRLSALSRLLYAVFVVSSENSTVAELAATLQTDLSQLQAAASFACRLGWAVKLIDPASALHESTAPGIPNINLSDEEDGSHANVSSLNTSIDGSSLQQGDLFGAENYGPTSAYTRVAFVVDANITSYLMMGSVSPGLSPGSFFFFFGLSSQLLSHLISPLVPTVLPAYFIVSSDDIM